MQTFSFETRSGTSGTIKAVSLAEARQRLAEQFGSAAVESIQGERSNATAAATGSWDEFWTKVRALPPR